MYKCLTVLLLEYVVIWQMTLVCIDWRVVTLMAFMNYAALWTLCSKLGIRVVILRTFCGGDP